MTVVFEPGRVVEVWAPAKPKGMIGSGYLLGAGLVLTAGHVVDRASAGSCEARPLGSEGWLPTELMWRGESCDAALLRIPLSDRVTEIASQLGRITSGERTPCRAVGFPYAQSKEAGDVRDTEDLSGEIRPLSTLKGGALTVHIAGSVPKRDPSGHSPWEGMSGAALFSGPSIVGVVVVAPAHFGTDRLEAVPTTAMAAEASFREALNGDPQGSLNLRAIEDIDITRGVLRDPYRPLPARATAERLRETASSFLVRPEYGVVPFHGRSDELERLRTWRARGSGLEIALLRGDGGTGKTRLAAELCRRAQTDGALAGFLEADAAGERLPRLAEASTSLLVVVDEAHARLDQLARLITELAGAPSDSPLRILLLSRQAGDWWESVLPLRLSADPDAELAYKTATLLPPLSPVDQGVSAREEAFAAAAAAFAARMERPVGELPVPDLGQPLFEQILFVHLAALSALAGEHALLGGQVLREDLLESALERESRYWVDTAETHGLELGPVVLARAVALATLTLAASEDEAARTLTAVPELADASQEGLRDTARWMRDLYPPPPTQPVASERAEPPWFRPLTPDLLGEALLARVLRTAPGLPTQLLANATAEQARRALAVLTPAARNHDVVERALRAALEGHLPALWEDALAVAQQAGDPLGRIVADVLEEKPEPELASAIAGSLPNQSVSLRELAVVATRQALGAIRERNHSASHDACLAMALNKLTTALAQVGRTEDALTVIEEAVAVYRDLAEAQPEPFLPYLAMALTNQSNALSELGHPERALAAIEEAVAVYRDLPEPHSDLAMALNNQSNALAELGRREEALAAIAQAVAVFRDLAGAQPEPFLPYLAGSLTNQSNALSELGHPERALAAIEEAVAIRRQLARAQADAFLPDLAMALNNESNRLSELDRREDALAAIEEAVAIRRQLANTRPKTFLPYLATSLNNQSVQLRALRRGEEALAAIEEAVAIRRQLANTRPKTFLPYLATSLSNRSNCLSELGRREDAEAAMTEAVAVRHRAFEEHPGGHLPSATAHRSPLGPPG